MPKLKLKYKILIPITLILILFTSILIILKVSRKPLEWSADNSLIPVAAPALQDDRPVDSLVQAIDLSLRFLEQLEADEEFIFGGKRFSSQQVRDSLLDVKDKLAQWGLTEDFFLYLRDNYRFYRSAVKEVRFTGYFEARLKGSLKPSETYAYPLYRKPDDLVQIDLSQFYFFDRFKGLPRRIRGRLNTDNRIVPYYDRREIDSHQALVGRGLEMVWVDDPIDLFFLQIQGSGLVQLESGGSLRVNYADSNGHPYRAIGRLLVEQGVLSREDVSMQSIRRYLEQHPEEMAEIFNYNPSYVFFRQVAEGPIGAIGVPLTPLRSIAVDPYIFPRGVLCTIDTQLPVFDKDNQLTGWQPFRGFVLNQDTGGVIRGPARVDLFTGNGPHSELIAGHLNQTGTLHFLIKKQE
jgi:membrane-bound lytic murein transglycosylase A